MQAIVNVLPRSHRGEEDLEAIARLINTCKAANLLNEGTSAAELRQELNDPSRQDSCLWEDETGQLVGYAELWFPEAEELDGFLWFCIHPAVGSGDLGKEILAWGETQMRAASQARGGVAKLYSSDRSDRTERITLLEACGFAAERYFLRMARSLAESIPEPPLPEGFTLIPANPEVDALAWLEMFNQTFIDHWNHHDMTLEQLQHYLSHPHYNPELDLIAVAPDGTFAAFCYCEINSEENQRNGCKEGWIASLGTRRGFRKQGLGRAMLLSGLQRLQAAGVETALLGVDAENPNGALRLYESVGFRKIYTNIAYVKHL
jgi:mycothiol synthase